MLALAISGLTMRFPGLDAPVLAIDNALNALAASLGRSLPGPGCAKSCWSHCRMPLDVSQYDLHFAQLK